MGFETVRFSVDSGVATVSLNRPDALNALNDQMAVELREALEQAAQDRDVRAVILTGEGRAFCSGQDLKSVSPDGTLGEHLNSTWIPIVNTIVEMRKPTIAAVNGVAAGAGAGIALACDLRLASEKASFIIVFSKVGLVPDAGCTWLLPRLVGHARAMEMAYLAEPVRAEEAFRIGLVNRVHPPDELSEAATALAVRLASGPTAAYSWTKQAMLSSWDLPFTDSLQLEADLQSLAGATEDFVEGVTAFAEKRDPEFRGS